MASESLCCRGRAGSFPPARDSASALPTPWGWDAGKPGQEGQQPPPTWLPSTFPRQWGQPCCCLHGGGGGGDPVRKLPHEQMPPNTLQPHVNRNPGLEPFIHCSVSACELALESKGRQRLLPGAHWDKLRNRTSDSCSHTMLPGPLPGPRQT